jgi:hypothetical protein
MQRVLVGQMITAMERRSLFNLYSGARKVPCIPTECQQLARGCARNERHPW